MSPAYAVPADPCWQATGIAEQTSSGRSLLHSASCCCAPNHYNMDCLPAAAGNLRAATACRRGLQRACMGLSIVEIRNLVAAILALLSCVLAVEAGASSLASYGTLSILPRVSGGNPLFPPGNIQQASPRPQLRARASVSRALRWQDPGSRMRLNAATARRSS